jgi:mannosyltransferase
MSLPGSALVTEARRPPRDASPGSGPATRTAARRRERLVLGAVVVAATLLRLPALGEASLWLDEGWSLATARLPWRALLGVVASQDSNASAYYVLLHAWLRLGEDAWTLRLLSVAAGIATVPVVFLLGRRLASARVGLLAATLVAVNGFHVQYAQEARSYALAVLLATASTLLFVRGVEAAPATPAWRSWGGYVLATALAVHAHAFALLVPAAHLASLAFLPRRAVPWRRVLAAAAATGALLLPLGLVLLERLREPSAPLGWAPALSVRLVAGLFWLLSGNTNYVDRSARDALLGMPLLGVTFVLCAVALVGAARAWRDGGRTADVWRRALLASWLLVPIALLAAASLVRPMFVSKYLVVCLPALSLLAAVGIGDLRRGRVRAAATVAVLALGLAALPPYYAARARNREWQDATAHLLAQARPDDAALFCVGPGRILFEHYAARPGGTASPSTTPLAVAYPATAATDPESLRTSPPIERGSLERLAAAHPRVWLVLYHDEYAGAAEVSRRLQGGLATRYRLTGAERFPGPYERVAVLRYERRE